MHEYSLMQRIIETICKNMEEGSDFQGRQVKEVVLQIGSLDIHSPESFRQAFEVLARETALASSTLRLKVIPGTISCPKCGFQGVCQEDVDGHDPLPCTACPQCGTISGVIGGRGIEAIELILED
ncbi:MAG: hydrogenase maturation nickel metallochaperone HypA [Deltaproteobacteria bacterium]|nr:hydrogenase maturation nickel metallochaperone HypA [Deltaproteobacteria bacterium]